MRILIILAGLTAIALVPVLEAQPPVEKPDPALQQLIQQLGDTEFNVREQASKQLRAVGAKALPALRKAVEHTDLEIRNRAKDLLAEIELTLLFAPKRVTLKAVNKPLPEVFQELLTQTGYKIECPLNDPARRYNFDLADVTFWEAIDRIAHDAGLVLQLGYNDQIVRLQQVDGSAPYIHREGPFRFTATGFQQFKNVDLSVVRKNPTASVRSETLTFQFSISSEPKLPMLGMGEVKLLAAYDSERNTMLPPVEPLLDTPNAPGRGRWTSRNGGYRTLTQQTQVQLVRASEKASSVKLLRGNVPVNLLVEEKKVVVAEKVLAAKGKKYTFGSVTINVEDVTVLPDKQVQIKMSVAEENHGNDYSWTNTLHNRFELYDAKGNKYNSHGSSWNSSSPAAIQATFHFGGLANADEPGKFIFHSWTTMSHLVTFEFKDLPLP